MAPAGIGDRVEGLHAVAAAIAAGRVRTLHVEQSRLRHDDVAAIESSIAVNETLREAWSSIPEDARRGSMAA